MRVAFTPGNAVWPSFTAFFAFKRRLAKEIGIELEQMTGFGGSIEWSTVRDSLVPLLAMPDATGSLPVAECGPVAFRLRHVIAAWPEDDEDRARAGALADALDQAVQLRVRLRFEAPPS